MGQAGWELFWEGGGAGRGDICAKASYRFLDQSLPFILNSPELGSRRFGEGGKRAKAAQPGPSRTVA